MHVLPTVAYELGLEAEQWIPEDSALIKLWPIIVSTTSVETQPAGVEVVWKDYNKPDDPLASRRHNAPEGPAFSPKLSPDGISQTRLSDD